MANGRTPGTKPTCKDQNSVPKSNFGPPAPTINSKSDGGRYDRTSLDSSRVAGECEKGTGKDGNC